MNSADLIKLARLFDKFIELESSFVKVDEIKAIRKVDPTNKDYAGIEVITPNGTFMDTTDFDGFRTRINDTLELLKEQGSMKDQSVMKDEPLPGRVITASTDGAPVTITRPSEQKPQLEQAQRKVIPQKSSRQVTIPVGRQGAEGKLFDDPNLTIVDRAHLVVSTPDGAAVLAQGKDGGVVQGEKVSGFIYANGGYKLIFKEYPHQSALVSFAVNVRGGA